MCGLEMVGVDCWSAHCADIIRILILPFSRYLAIPNIEGEQHSLLADTMMILLN